MKNKKREDLDFDFDVKKEKKPSTSPVKVEYSTEPASPKRNRVRIAGITLDLSEDCLIIRRRTSTIKEKTMIALDEIESTKVKKVSRPVLLVLAILFLVIGGVIFYPIYLHLNDYVIPLIIICSAVLLFVIFLIAFLTTKSLQLIINFSSTRNIKYTTHETKMFEKLNDFIDEVYHVKHQLYKIKK